ncbi:MAG TPA: DUF2231 domain-containing protein [Gammaproteobacteria bacterium]|nr:DUF2231 domain-containing protein [Gammaproteobacteria bacterium]
MPEIIPNWHPIFVHFTLGLFSAATGFYVVFYLFKHTQMRSKKVEELEIAARWCLWSSGFITIVTVAAGLYAFNTVKHDGISHIAMMTHRNWALPTAILIIALAIWSGWNHFKQQQTLTHLFLISLIITQALLFTTALYGGEMVYRYGIGVQSLPQTEKFNHHHFEMTIENPPEPKPQHLHSPNTSNEGN